MHSHIGCRYDPPPELHGTSSRVAGTPTVYRGGPSPLRNAYRARDLPAAVQRAESGDGAAPHHRRARVHPPVRVVPAASLARLSRAPSLAREADRLLLDGCDDRRRGVGPGAHGSGNRRHPDQSRLGHRARGRDVRPRRRRPAAHRDAGGARLPEPGDDGRCATPRGRALVRRENPRSSPWVCSSSSPVPRRSTDRQSW